ncbi:hypothetical protein M5689_019300 [Euphorbia peplus]|nr:hypothetical protein M5689_019300 [Euphorbia peplus]
MWSLSLPPRVESFIWKLCHNFLPLKGNLLFKGVQNDNLCCLCGEGGEHCVHTFIDCEYARNVWWSLNIDSFISGSDFFVEWFEGFLDQRTLKECHLLCMGLWEIWCQCNSSYWDGSAAPLVIATKLCRNFLDQFHRATPSLSLVRGAAGISRWFPPAPGHLKLNIDASCKEDRDQIGFGGILHGSVGKFVFAYSAFKIGFFSPAMAKILGLERALHIILDRGWANVDIAMDAEVVVNAFHSSSPDYSEFGVVLELCKGLGAQCRDISADITSSSFPPIPRMGSFPLITSLPPFPVELQKYPHLFLFSHLKGPVSP